MCSSTSSSAAAGRLSSFVLILVCPRFRMTKARTSATNSVVSMITKSSACGEATEEEAAARGTNGEAVELPAAVTERVFDL